MAIAFLNLIKRDLQLAIRGGIGSLMAVVFFIVSATLFPLGIGPESALLERIAPGALWVCALLASMLSLNHLFQNDYDDGSLEVIMLGPLPLELVTVAKVLAHWFSTSIPLIVIAPILAILLNMNSSGFATLMYSLLLGTPILSLIGSIGASLTLGTRRGGILVSLLVLPIYVPVLIFATGAIEGAIFGFEGSANLLILAAGLIASLVLAPWASAAALRMAVE